LTFLNPFALFGLLAAGIPILLHIFNLRKLQTIEFSTLSFLKELQKTKIRRLKIRQLLLLFLRTLLIILIVLAFSRPTLKGSLPGGLAEQAKTTAVILFDDSQSMTASDGQGELLHQAKTSAAAVLNIFKDGDEVFLVKLSDITLDGTKEIPSAMRNIPVVRSDINEIVPSSIHRSIEDGLRFAARLLSASRNFNKEVYVISDFQSGSVESAAADAKTDEQLFSTSTQFFVVPLGKRELQNVSLESITIPTTIVEVNRPFVVSVKLANHGSADLQNHVISVYQNGSRVAQKGVDIRARQKVETEFQLVPKRTGFLEGIIELEDDDLEFDNRRYFTVHIPDIVHVLLVGSSSDLNYLRLAFSTRLSDSSAIFNISETRGDRFSSSQLHIIDVAVFSNLRELTVTQIAAIKTFLQNGGGVLLFPGNQTTAASYNSLASALGISTIAPVEVQVSSLQTQSAQPASSFIEFDNVDLRHPLFSGMFEEREPRQSNKHPRTQPTLESPRVKTSLRFLSTPSSQNIITLTNGSPFLIEDQVGNGRVFTFSTAANTEWSDFPLKGLFVPLILRAAAFLAQEPNTGRSLLAGEERTAILRSSVPPTLTIAKPGGRDVSVAVRQQGKERVVRFSNTDTPGLYTMLSGITLLDKFAVNIDPAESNTAPADETRLKKIYKRLGMNAGSIHRIDQPQELQRRITESRVGSELWKQFLIAALVIALIEMLVARDSRRSHALMTTQTK